MKKKIAKTPVLQTSRASVAKFHRDLRHTLIECVIGEEKPALCWEDSLEDVGVGIREDKSEFVKNFEIAEATGMAPSVFFHLSESNRRAIVQWFYSLLFGLEYLAEKGEHYVCPYERESCEEIEQIDRVPF